MPAFILPQLFLCGIFTPREDMAALLYWISFAMPLTYAYDALARATSPAALDARVRDRRRGDRRRDGGGAGAGRGHPEAAHAVRLVGAWHREGHRPPRLGVTLAP